MEKTFEEVLDIKNGKNQKTVENPDGKYPIYGSGGIMGYADKYICEANTVIIGRKGNINNPIYVETPFWNVDTAFGLVAKPEKLIPKYLYYFCKYFDFEKLNTTVTIPSLTKTNLLKIKINVPELIQQSKEVDVLDKVSRVIEARKTQLKYLNNLIKSRFVEMFGDPISNPMGWKRITFKESSIILSDGPFGSNLKSEHYCDDEGIRIIRLQNIGVGKFVDSDKAFIPQDHYEKIEKYTCYPGEIVIGTMGTPNLRACIIPDYINKAIHKADCVRFVPKEELLNNIFACQYINCPETLSLASDKIHGQTRARISSGQVALLQIYLPPIDLQNQFAAFVQQVDKLKFVLKGIQ